MTWALNRTRTARWESQEVDRERLEDVCMLIPDMLLKWNYSDKIKEDQTVQRSNQEPKDQKDKTDDKEISTWRSMILLKMNERLSVQTKWEWTMSGGEGRRRQGCMVYYTWGDSTGVSLVWVRVMEGLQGRKRRRGRKERAGQGRGEACTNEPQKSVCAR